MLIYFKFCKNLQRKTFQEVYIIQSSLLKIHKCVIKTDIFCFTFYCALNSRRLLNCFINSIKNLDSDKICLCMLLRHTYIYVIQTYEKTTKHNTNP